MSNYSLPLLVGNRVAKLRKLRGYSQTQLANMVGCSKNTISLIETGQQYPNLDLAFCICSVFRVSVEDVFIPMFSGKKEQ